MCMTKTAFVGLIAITLIASSGCGTTKDSPSKTYQDDGYLGMSNTNPNFPINPSYQGYEQDTNTMRAALGNVNGIRDTRINLNGPYATVKLFVQKEATDQDMVRIKQEAELELSKVAPGYKFYVKMSR